VSEIEWKPFYSINIEEIDNQHRKLVNMLNQLAGSLHKGVVNEEIGNVLKQLVEYTRDHFSAEEKLMREIEYQGYVPHKKMHQDLTDQVVVILKNIRNGKKVDVFDMMSFLQRWLINHIVEEDMKIGKAWQSRRNKQPVT